MKHVILVLATAVCIGAQTCLVFMPQQFVDAEPLVGTKDGKNHVFTLGHVPTAGSTPLVTLNGLVQRMGVTADYTISGKTITFVPNAAVPQSSNENLLAWYRWQP